MKQIEKIAESENFSAIGLGKLSELNEFVLELNPAVKIPGKVFGGAALQATGAEFSFQSYAPARRPGSSTPTKPMRNSTSFSRARVNARSTARSSRSVKVR